MRPTGLHSLNRSVNLFKEPLRFNVIVFDDRFMSLAVSPAFFACGRYLILARAVIAVNRYTAFALPQAHSRIWRLKTVAVILIVFLVSEAVIYGFTIWGYNLSVSNESIEPLAKMFINLTVRRSLNEKGLY